MASHLARLVSSAMDDAVVVAALRDVLAAGDHTVELDGTLVVIPRDVPLEIIAESVHSYRVAMSFGDHVRALVAIGGVASVTAGVVDARICFASVFIRPDGAPITVDFSRLMP